MNEGQNKRELFPDLGAEGALRAAFQSRERPSTKATPATRSSSAQGGTGQHAYELRGEIARGGMGVIIQAFDRELDRDVALKVLREELASEPQLVRRFFEEARVTARLDHPGIVPVHEVGRDPEGRAYFAMRLVRGRELKRIIELSHANAEGWSQARALSVIQKVCEAMAYAHDKGVIHRDLKPSNVMVGEFGEVYVMDWGLARTIGTEDAHDLRLRNAPKAGAPSRATDSASTASSASNVESPIVTMDGEVLGTPCYMAPEQAQGRIAELGPRSDVYSVGAMLYHLLAGEMPYVPKGSSVASRKVLMNLVQGPPLPLHALRSDVSPELIALCEKAMSREPEDRYPDMLAMADDLRAFLERRVVRAYETGAWAEAKKWMQRNKALAGALAMTFTALLAGLLVSLSLKATSDSNFVRAEDSAQVANHERDNAMRSASFMEDALAGVTTSVALGRDTTMLREMMDAAWSRLEQGELAAAPLAELRLMLVIGGAFSDIAQYEKAEPILTLTLEKARRLCVGDDPVLADAETKLGILLRNRGKLDAAEPLLREALALQKRLFPGDHRDVARAIENLAALLESRGDLAGAEAHLREALLMHRRIASGDDVALAGNLGNLGVVLQARGDLPGAEALLREAIEMEERIFHGDHPYLATTLNNLGALMSARGDQASAEQLHRRALDMRRRLFPKDHPDLAVSINNLALALLERGDLDGAEALLREALAMQRRLLDGDQVAIVSALVNLGVVLRMQANPEGAEPLLREAFAMKRRLVVGDNADLAQIESNLAVLLQTRGDLASAEPFSREALEMRKRLFPGDNPDVAKSMANLANLLEGRGDLAGSEALFREALRMLLAIQPEADPSVATARADLGQLLSLEQHFSEADEVLLAAAPVLTRDNRVGLAWNKVCVERIIANYTAWDEAEPGRGILARADEWKRKLLVLEQH